MVCMIHTDYAIARIRAYLKQSGVAKSRLAIMAGVPEGCVRNVKSKRWNPTFETLRKIESAIPRDFSPSTQHNGATDA